MGPTQAGPTRARDTHSAADYCVYEGRKVCGYPVVTVSRGEVRLQRRRRQRPAGPRPVPRARRAHARLTSQLISSTGGSHVRYRHSYHDRPRSIRPQDSGVILPHEHLFLDLSCYWTQPTEMTLRAFAEEPVGLTPVADTAQPAVNKDNCRLDNLDVAVNELREYAKLGAAHS